jgi:hypothetical protein
MNHGKLNVNSPDRTWYSSNIEARLLINKKTEEVMESIHAYLEETIQERIDDISGATRETNVKIINNVFVSTESKISL